MKIKSLLAISGLISIICVSNLHAQQSNDQYYQEQAERQRQAHAAEMNRVGYMNQQNQQEAEQVQIPKPSGEWKTMWGAIAADGPKGILGAATGMETEQSAKEFALAECRKRGGVCEIQTTYANQCAALITGSKVYNIKLASSEGEATQKAMNQCNEGDTNCRVYYAACSKAEFVHY